MKPLTFRGGVHPYEGKELSMDRKIRRLRPGKEMAYLLSQHIGAPAVPVVKKGDYVKIGQMLARPVGFVSCPVHASVSGTVKGFEKRKNVVGEYVDAIIVENDDKYEHVEYHPIENLSAYTRREILQKIQDAGIVGMGGAGFPTHAKLSQNHPETIDYVLVNGAECEPYLTSDYRCMMDSPEKLIGGLKVVLYLFEEKCQGVICIEDNKPDAIKLYQELTKDEPRISVAVLKTKYPQGAERNLIYAVTGRKVNASMLPAHVGCLVDNVATINCIYEAVMLGMPMSLRVFTVSGDAVVNPRTYVVPIGMSYKEIIDLAGGFNCEPEKIISGGPMMGFALADLDIPVTKTFTALTCFKKDEVARLKETACISCGRCLEACPASLMPSKLSDFAEHDDMELFLEYNGMECVSCGSCSYGCPAKRPLAANITAMRRKYVDSRRR